MKIALTLSDDATTARRLTSDMLEAQRHEAECATRVLPFTLGCLGLLGRPDESPTTWLAWEGADGSFLAFAGLPLRTGGPGAGPVRASDPLVTGALAGDEPADTMSRLGALDGAFVALWWSQRRGELALVTDFLGMQPLYRATAAGATVFASEVKAFARAGALPIEADAGAWGAMLLFGHQIGPRSLLAGAERVPAATAMVFGPGRAQRACPTWAWPSTEGLPDSPSLRDAIGEAVRADVGAYAAAYPDASILLSGGFDSRLILCLCRDLGLRPRAIVQSHPDENADADAHFAEAFARVLGLPVRRVPARADFFGSAAYLDFLERNEVATPSYQLFIPNVAAAVAPERRGVWEGLLLDPALKFEYGEGGFAPYLDARARARGQYREAARLVFAREWADRMEAEYEALLAAERTQFADDPDGVWRFSVLNRSRFRTGVNPYQVYETVTLALTPGMSRRFWEAVARADPRARFGKRLYRAVFERLAPDGLRVPIATGSTLLPGRGGAGLYHAQRARAAVQRFAQRPKVARLLRSAGLPGPFTWERSRFLDVALAEASLDDPRLNADWIRRRRAEVAAGPVDEAALEVLMYWQAWHHVMRGDLRPAWG
ncbi:MAG TPA: hypothetical protein VFS08_14265 [Gemmatimonadaceae bacterium]|nr:hypothetical protein [Gemmatimonadaceae bacterium]